MAMARAKGSDPSSDPDGDPGTASDATSTPPMGYEEARAALAALSASGERFDLVLFDPPYDDLALRDEALRALASPEAPLRPGSLVVATGRRRTAGAPAVGGTLRLVRELPFGETSIQLLERTEGAAG